MALRQGASLVPATWNVWGAACFGLGFAGVWFFVMVLFLKHHGFLGFYLLVCHIMSFIGLVCFFLSGDTFWIFLVIKI